MDRRDSWYPIKGMLFYIGLVNQERVPIFIQKMYGIKDDKVRQWIGKCYKELVSMVSSQ